MPEKPVSRTTAIPGGVVVLMGMREAWGKINRLERGGRLRGQVGVWHEV
ncbi:hypothetical protein [Streptomyces sp. NPDC018693]